MEELRYGSVSKEEKKQEIFSQKLGNGGYNHKITDWNKFTEFAKKYGGIGNG
ncbi:hypothetical protein wKueTS_09490 [Wolbachia pipientis]